MTLFDLLFLVCTLASLVAIVRVVYFLARKKSAPAVRTAKRWGIGAAVYLMALLGTSVAQPERTVAAGAPSCFDDFCIAIDSASRLPLIGESRAKGTFVIVSGRVISTMGGGRQRETDIRGLLRDDTGVLHEVSDAGQRALRATGRAGSALTDYVGPRATNMFRLAYDVPATSHELDFITTHGWFPGAFIIGSPQSLLHRPVVIHLP